jgi:hypothetical protein
MALLGLALTLLAEWLIYGAAFIADIDVEDEDAVL